jgi:hypothetical protein
MVDDDRAEADIVLPQRSVPELMAELERSKQDELERLAEKLESDPIGDLLGGLPTLIQASTSSGIGYRLACIRECAMRLLSR